MATLKGRWLFNEVVGFPVFVSGEWYGEYFTFTNDALNREHTYLSFTNNSSDKYMSFGSSGSPYRVYDFNTNSWYGNGGKQITFDGTQTVSKEFYDWFTANARIADLTGYTVTVPAGWSAEAGYGFYDLYGYWFDEEKGVSVFGIGYDYFDSQSSDFIFISTLTRAAGVAKAISPSSSFTLEIQGGTDATNTSLIQWFVDNNATFEKTGEEEPDTPEEPTTPTATITYDGATVTLKEGQTITFRFAEKVFKSDIVIRNNVQESTEQNYTIKAGEYFFIDKPDLTNMGEVYTPINFVAGFDDYYEEFQEIFIDEVSSSEGIYYTNNEHSIRAYNSWTETWLDSEYQALTVFEDTTVSKEFYEWFVRNTEIAFDVTEPLPNGSSVTTYSAKNGMTWGEWVESDYNPVVTGQTYKTFYRRGNEIDGYNICKTNSFLNVATENSRSALVSDTDKIIQGFSYILYDDE